MCHNAGKRVRKIDLKLIQLQDFVNILKGSLTSTKVRNYFDSLNVIM